MNQFIYETHLHTCEGSACGVTRGADYIEAYSKAGYAGIMVTDHFFNGNCAVDRSLPWEEKIELYCKGYEHALERAELWNKANGTDFKVFFGVEFTFDGDDYLLYGIDKAWLKAHPEMMNWTHAELFEQIKAAGGLMVQAHPYRKRDYIKRINLHPESVHAVEAFNSGNNPEENPVAFTYAREHNLPVTSGSDMHHFRLPEADELPFGGMAFDTPLETIGDYIKRVKAAGEALKADPSASLTSGYVALHAGDPA
ncbi:MAG: histidinol-phosphatase [Treponema sp.]|nr:histidinol-phosphatase [Candidatus Treponema caballi]